MHGVQRWCSNFCLLTRTVSKSMGATRMTRETKIGALAGGVREAQRSLARGELHR